MKASISIKVPTSADEWELYTCDEELSSLCDRAATELTAALEKAIRSFLSGESQTAGEALVTHWCPVSEKWARCGAADSEPIWHAERAMRRAQEVKNVAAGRSW